MGDGVQQRFAQGSIRIILMLLTVEAGKGGVGLIAQRHVFIGVAQLLQEGTCIFLPILKGLLIRTVEGPPL